MSHMGIIFWTFKNLFHLHNISGKEQHTENNSLPLKTRILIFNWKNKVRHFQIIISVKRMQCCSPFLRSGTNKILIYLLKQIFWLSKTQGSQYLIEVFPATQKQMDVLEPRNTAESQTLYRERGYLFNHHFQHMQKFPTEQTLTVFSSLENNWECIGELHIEFSLSVFFPSL